MGWKAWAAGIGALVVLGSYANADPDAGTGRPAASTSADRSAAAPADAAASAVDDASTELLFVTDLKDGDSWDASDGQEYRLGLVDTPERGEPCAAEATAFTRRFLADGFTADAYSGDTHGRVVAEVFSAEGRSLNVALARSGLGGDRYLEQFRHENPDLARRIDAALADARRPDCASSSTKPVPLVDTGTTKKPTAKAEKDCMAGYSPCLPIVADLDCPDIGHPVAVTGSDPYGLDRDGDGTGCD